MKYLYQSIIFVMLAVFSSCSSSRYYTQDDYGQNYSDENVITYQQFYNDLTPYGNWVNYGNYGYVWRPGIAGFRPYYTNGNWVYTNYGWTWASNYNWGWAPFHYGRWINDMAYGWMWIPGNEWAPAWVLWRGSGNYYGWAPLGPGMNANISNGSIPYNYWTFVPNRYINSPRINNYYVDQSRNVTIINNTSIINHTSGLNQNGHRAAYNPGPSVAEVERSVGTRIRRYNVVESNNPGTAQINNNAIRVFRPAVKPQPNGNPRPERVVNLENNSPDRNNGNRESNAPVREIPQDQSPQINRNEPRVNNRPSITPNRDNTPTRVLPNRNRTEAPAERNPDLPKRNPQPQNNPPVRTLPPDNASQRLNRSGDQQNTIKRNTSVKAPVEPKRNRNNSGNSRQQNEPVNRPVRKISTERKESTSPAAKPVVREKREIKTVKPAQEVRHITPRKKD